MATTDREQAAQARAAALKNQTAQFIEALRVERDGYVVRGLPDRVAAVEEQLRLRGAEVSAPDPGGDSADGDETEGDRTEGDRTEGDRTPAGAPGDDEAAPKGRGRTRRAAPAGDDPQA
ncbi:hypothetical protein [Cellulomonas oligotrophica]|uniref:Uncharacterized protein n=1 Tax=Cellulomonas oligotrophica TaxID=931536 RepID=A0A7Y9FIA3_9CELL|nr:hypothetical protein [Cellulomonas oligotrophica]NYD87780.1 hypothetical protein [Cellulomonas oligotrophica]GIG33016.1 hypothetical protein Col01nite_21750 [Cellulomonas oligotrophica]